MLFSACAKKIEYIYIEPEYIECPEAKAPTLPIITSLDDIKSLIVREHYMRDLIKAQSATILCYKTQLFQNNKISETLNTKTEKNE